MLESRTTNACAAMAQADFDELAAIARQYHEAQSWMTWILSKVTAFADLLPGFITKGISAVLRPALQSSNWAALHTHVDSTATGLGAKIASVTRSKWFHRIAVTASGAAGGALGAATAIVDVAASTTLILRQVQTIALEYEEDLSLPEARLECINVLALGGPEGADDKLDDAFWTTRASLKVAITQTNLLKLMQMDTVQKAAATEAAQSILNAPLLVRILDRFGIATQAAFIAKAVPYVGAGVGAYVNYTFMAYYDDMAHVHYRLKRLESKYERAQIRSCFDNILRSLREGGRQ